MPECSDGHKPIWYQSCWCPLCQAQQEISLLKAKWQYVDNVLFYGGSQIARAMGMTYFQVYFLYKKHGLPLARVRQKRLNCKYMITRRELEIWWAKQFYLEKIPDAIRRQKKKSMKPIYPLIEILAKHKDRLAPSHWIKKNEVIPCP